MQFNLVEILSVLADVSVFFQGSALDKCGISYMLYVDVDVQAHVDIHISRHCEGIIEPLALSAAGSQWSQVLR